MINSIYFHAGMHKTGSSFIQTQIALRRKELISSKIYIPADERFHLMENAIPTAGNGFKLSTLIKLDKIDEAIELIKLDINKAELSHCDKILYSSESFFHLFHYNIVEWIKLEEKLQKLKIKTEGLIFFRNPVDHIISTFKHRFKNKYLDFDQWLNNDYETIEITKNFLNVRGDLHTKWIFKNYSFHKKHICKYFFKDWLNIDFPHEQENALVNKSLELSDIYLSHLVKPLVFNQEYKLFIKKLNSLPAQYKPDESRLIDNLKLKSYTYVWRHQNIFEKVNEILPANEALEIPNKEYISEMEVDNFFNIQLSNYQIELYFNFMKNNSNKTLRQSLRIIKKELINIFT